MQPVNHRSWYSQQNSLPEQPPTERYNPNYYGPLNASDLNRSNNRFGATSSNRHVQNTVHSQFRANQQRFFDLDESNGYQWLQHLQSNIDLLKDEASPPLTVAQVRLLLYGLKNKEQKTKHFNEHKLLEIENKLLEFLEILAPKITQVGPFNGQAIGNALYGLQNLKSSEAVDAVLSALAKHITPNVVLNGQNVGNALYGLQNLKNSEAVEAVLSALGTRITPNVVLKGQAIGNALYGLQNLKNSEAVEAVLSALAKHITPNVVLNGQNVGNALYGLQNLKNSEAVEAVLSALGTRITPNVVLKGQAIGNALYGLQNLKNSEAVEAVLNALAKLITPNVVLNGQAIGNALYGLKNLKNSEAVEAVLSALAKHITPNVVLNGQNVGNALYGLQNLKSSDAVEAVLSALGTRITPNVVLNGQEIGNAIFGLSCLDETPSSTTLLEQILTNLSAAVGNQKFSAQSIVYKSFSKWLQPLGHLETKLNFLKTMLQPDQSWTEVARCLNLSDYRKLRSSIQTTQDNQFPLASMLLKVIRESNDPKLLQLRQLTDPQQHSEELLARNAPPPSQQQALLLYAAIEATQDQMGSQLNIGLVRKINCLHKLLPPALTVAGLNPRCESLLPPQNIRLGTTGNKSQRPDLVILLPTRGHKPDVPPMQFLRSLDQSLTEARKLNAETSVLVVLGINGQDEGQAAKDAIVLRSEGVATSIKADRGFKNNIQVKLLTFSWATDQNPGAKRIIPFGTIRNHCFDQAIVGMPDSARFVSMDGDTTLTAPALERIMALGANEATTLAYRLDKQSQKENSATSAALDLHWKIQAKTNMTLNGRTNSLAYPAEPCLAVGSAGLQRLKTLHIDQQKVFGSTDCEGRFLMRNLLAGDVRFVPVNEANAVEFHNFARFQVKQYPLTNRDQLIKQLSAYAGQSQNMSNLDFFTRQLAFGLSRPDAFIRPVTKPLYVPNLLKSGLSLKKIQDVLSSLPELKSLNKAHAFAADAIGNLSKEVFEGYQRCIQYCGIDYANTIFDNALEWAKTVTGEAIGLSLKTPRHTRTELLNGNIPNTRVAAQLKGPEPGTSAWGASGFAAAGLGVVRQNKDPRDVYPQLPKPLERLGSKRAAFLSLNQPIPKKRRVDESATAALPTREQKNLKPDFRTIYNTAFSKLSGQMRDLYSLLNAEHFGEQRLMSESEIREQFYCQVLDVIGDETVSETQMKQYIRESLFNILRGSVVSA